MIDAPQTSEPQIPGANIPLIVYGLYFVAYVVPITAIIGVIVAHMQVANATPLLQNHYRFQIRTFWIGMLYYAIVAAIVLMGISEGATIGPEEATSDTPLWVLVWGVVMFVVMIWVFIWSLIRNVKGILALIDHRPLANPTSWMFG